MIQRSSCVRVGLFVAAVAALVGVTLLAGSSQVFAGGIRIKVGTAQISAADGARQNVLTVTTQGCYQPELAVITAQAVGIVAGKEKKVVTIKLDQTGPGVYQITRQWPAEGAWVLGISAEVNGLVSSAVVRLDEHGAIPAELAQSTAGSTPTANSVQIVQRKLTAGDLDAALNAMPGKQIQAAIFGWQPLSLLAVAALLVFSVKTKLFKF